LALTLAKPATPPVAFHREMACSFLRRAGRIRQTMDAGWPREGDWTLPAGTWPRTWPFELVSDTLLDSSSDKPGMLLSGCSGSLSPLPDAAGGGAGMRKTPPSHSTRYFPYPAGLGERGTVEARSMADWQPRRGGRGHKSEGAPHTSSRKYPTLLTGPARGNGYGEEGARHGVPRSRGGAHGRKRRFEGGGGPHLGTPVLLALARWG